MVRAIVVTETGGPDVLIPQDVDVGKPGPGEVRLRQTAIGVNFIDTAAMYNRSEERIGRFLASRREEFFLATKCGVHRAGGEAGAEIVEDYSRDGILRVVEESRSRLRMDVIDLVQFHGSPPVELVDEAFTALLELKARGRTCPGNDPGRVRHALYSFAC